MPGSRLAHAVSPYLRSHAGNPVDWFPWGAAAFQAARARDVPVLLSIGYSTCHWCHVMARESFSDEALAARLNAGFVAVKVDREEHPEVDEAYMAAASAFTPHLGWPLNVFVTPDGRAFFASTYSPPTPIQGHPSFGQVLDAVEEAWRERRAEVERSAAGLVEALRDTAAGARAAAGGLDAETLAEAVDGLLAAEEPVHGGFGPGPKFPIAPALAFGLAAARSPLLDDQRRARTGEAVERALVAMATRGLRDPVEGGFFRYATRADWSEPHYERMLTDNALLLPVYADAGDEEVAAGIVAFLAGVLRRGDGAFGSAQDSESVVAGRRTEGGWFALDAAARARETPPAVDGKELTGWNGLAVGGLADAGAVLDRPEWVALAAAVADVLLARRRGDGSLVRAVLGGTASTAAATLEDVGGLADGLVRLAIAGGEARYAVAARDLVDAALDAGGGNFAVPGGGDPLLADLGVGVGGGHTSEGATPSGIALIAGAAWRLHLLTGQARYAAASRAAIARLLPDAVRQPTGFGAVLELAVAQASPLRQTVVVGDPSAPLAAAARLRRDDVVAIVTEAQGAALAAAGFALFDGRTGRGSTLAYLCDDFVCALPTADPAAVTV